MQNIYLYTHTNRFTRTWQTDIRSIYSFHGITWTSNIAQKCRTHQKRNGSTHSAINVSLRFGWRILFWDFFVVFFFQRNVSLYVGVFMYLVILSLICFGFSAYSPNAMCTIHFIFMLHYESASLTQIQDKV